MYRTLRNVLKHSSVQSDFRPTDRQTDRQTGRHGDLKSHVHAFKNGVQWSWLFSRYSSMCFRLSKPHPRIHFETINYVYIQTSIGSQMMTHFWGSLFLQRNSGKVRKIGSIWWEWFVSKLKNGKKTSIILFSNEISFSPFTLFFALVKAHWCAFNQSNGSNAMLLLEEIEQILLVNIYCQIINKMSD